MTRTVVSLALLTLVVGCATQGRWVFEKAGVSEADAKKDRSQCFAAAVADNTNDNYGPVGKMDREAYKKCMERRGYTLRAGQ
jgi:hypothetical protein